MKEIENVIIGKPVIEIYHLLGIDESDNTWIDNTVYTNERFLPKILVDLGLVVSTSWVRKNKPELFRELNILDFLEIKLGKKKKPIWIIVGESVE